ncbi:MAG: hypothetical protein K0S99_3755 [Thermomicrobiales bacterium]|nr:hypothetical protein [Thermomicrobiales bacterium]
MRGAWRLVAGASDVPTVWLHRLLRQVKEQARPRAFPPNWPSLDPALQRAGYGLGVVLCGRGPSRPDMTEVLLPGLTSDRHELRPPNFSAAGNPRSTEHRQDGPIPVEPERPVAHMVVRVGRRRPNRRSAEPRSVTSLLAIAGCLVRDIVPGAVRHGAHPVTRFCLAGGEQLPRSAQCAPGSPRCVARVDRSSCLPPRRLQH